MLVTMLYVTVTIPYVTMTISYVTVTIFYATVTILHVTLSSVLTHTLEWHQLLMKFDSEQSPVSKH